jgi:hypothetical protein
MKLAETTKLQIMFTFLSEKIAAKKKELGEDVKEQKATSVIEEFCAKFDQAVRNSFQMVCPVNKYLAVSRG